MKNKYAVIMECPHHVSRTHMQMPMSDRAAQFAPFAALTGYDSAIKETGRLTYEKIEADEEALADLDRRYRMLSDSQDESPEITITFYKADERKDGGAYLTVTGRVRKLDESERMIVMRNGSRIPMDNVLSVEGRLFSMLE